MACHPSMQSDYSITRPTLINNLGRLAKMIFLQELECGYRFPALIHVWIATAGVLELFIIMSGRLSFTLAC